MEKSQTSLDIRNPGLRALPPGVERYFVRGGGLSVLEVLPEDKLEIINDEGKQTCEVVVFNSKGKSDLSILNLKENSDASFSKKTILSDEKITKLFKRKKFDLSKQNPQQYLIKIVKLGEKITLKSKDKCTVMLRSSWRSYERS